MVVANTSEGDSSSSDTRVGVALVNWNGGEFTIPCIRSLYDGTRPPSLVVVVDNASHDDSPAHIATAYPEIVLIRNQRNEGFSGANNQAIEYLMQQDMDYIWILNNDTLVAADCLEKLLKHAQQSPTAAYSAKIYLESPSNQLWYAGAHRHPLHLAPIHDTTNIAQFQDTEQVVPVDFLSGCCIFAAALVFAQLGGFVTSYVAYSEDSDWSWRATTAGVPLYYVPSAVMWHRLSASLKKNTGNNSDAPITPRALYLMIRNHLWTVRRHASPRNMRYRSLAINVGIQLRNFANAMLHANMSSAMATAHGLCDGLLKPLPTDIPRWPQGTSMSIAMDR